MVPTDPPDSLMHELIQVVQDNTQKTIAVRSDVNAAITSMYTSIVRIERTLADEAKERPARQRELDRKIETITKRLDKQDQALESQDRALDTIYGSQRWRGYALVVIVVLLFVGVVLLLRG